MVKILILFLGLSAATSQAAVKRNVHLKASDIAEIYVNDPVKNLLVVKDKTGRLLKLKVSPQQREEIVSRVEGYQVASTAAVPAPAATTPLKAPVNETTAKMKDTKTEENKSPWGVGLLIFPDANIEKFNDGTGSVTSYNELSISYKLNDQWKIALKPSTLSEYSIEKGSFEHKMGSTAVQLSRGTFASLAGIDVSGSMRYYIPTGDSDRASGSNGMLRGDLSLKKPLGDFALKYDFSPRYYLQSNRSSASFDEYGRLEKAATANTSLRMINTLEASYALVPDKLSVAQSVAIDHRWKYSDPGVGLEAGSTSTLFGLSSSVAIDYLSFVSLTFYIDQQYDISAGKEHTGYSLYNPSETSFGMIAYFPIK